MSKGENANTFSSTAVLIVGHWSNKVHIFIFQCFFSPTVYKMPPWKNPIKLLELAIDNLHHLVRDEILRVSQIFEEVEDGQKVHENLREYYLSQQISAFKDHIFSHIPLYLTDHILGM